MQSLKISSKKTSNFYKRLIREFRYLWPLLLVSVAGSILYSACDAYAMYLVKPLLNKGFNVNGGDFLKKIALLFLLLFALRGIGSFLSSFFMGKLGAKVVYHLRKKIFNKFLFLPASYYDETSSGKLLSKFLYNVDQVTSATGLAIVTAVQDGTFIIGLIIVMVITSWQLSITIIIVTPILAFFITYISKKFRYYSRNTQSAMGSITQITEETLINYKEIRIFGGQEHQLNKFHQNLKYAYQQQIKTLILNGLSSPIIQFIGAIMISFILFIISIYALNGNSWLDAGSFVVFFASMMAILKPIKSLTNVNTIIQKAITATEDIFEIFDAISELDQGRKAIQKVQGKVQFKSLSFSYPRTTNLVLKNVNLTAKAGEVVALVGRSGSGKTTITNLLARFYQPTEGKILLDDEDIQSISLSNLRRHISLVAQNVNLFEDTIFHNIAYGNKDIAESKVIQAAKSANAWNFIDQLPEGLYTKVGQNGLNLSGGQRQRIAIARALLKNSPILILDEATSSLDNESEKIMQQGLKQIMKNCTTFVIAHRLSTVESADQIIVMDSGEIMEVGNHKSLLENKKGLYYKLYHQEFY